MTRTKDWLQYSEELVEIVDLLISNNKYSWACFTAHQASAAALKAVLSKIDQSTFGDNLIKLARTLKAEKTMPEAILKACRNNNSYFMSSRDLELQEKGTPLSGYSNEEATKAKKDALVILRYAHHECH